MSVGSNRTVIVCLATTVNVLVATSVLALSLQRESPTAGRISTGDSHVHPANRSWENFLAYSGMGNPGAGSGGRQIFIFRQREYVCQFGRPDLGVPRVLDLCPSQPRPYLTQVTSGAGDPDNPTLNHDATIVAFDAAGSFSGSTGADAAHRQIYTMNVRTGAVTQVTKAMDGDSVKPSLNWAGVWLVFESSAALLGGRTGVPQIFLYNVDSGVLRQLTNGAGPSTSAMLNKLGDRIALQSTADLKSGSDQRDTGVWQIFWFDRGNDSFVQVTRGDRSSQHPYIEEKNPGRLFFDSAATNLPPTLLASGTQIYFASTLDLVPHVTQLTFGPGSCRYPALEPSGGRVVFICDGDLFANGTTGNRLFALDLSEDADVPLYQITGGRGIEPPVGASLGPWMATVATTDDLAGTGVCGRQLYMVDYFPTHYYEPAHPRLAATQVGQVPAEPSPGDTNASCDDGSQCSEDTCINGATCSHRATPDSTPCGGASVDRCAPSGVCLGGACSTLPGVSCDDDDPCTQDVCTVDGVCEHTMPPAFDGLACRLAQLLEATSRVRLRRPQVLLLGRIQRLLEGARQQGPQLASRRLVRARGLLIRLLSSILKNRKLTRDQFNAIAQRARELEGQISSVKAELQALQRLQAGRKR